MKTCKKCKTSKPLDEFYKHKTNSDGRNGKCKSCCISYTTNRPPGSRHSLSPKTYAPRNHEHRAASRHRFRTSEKGKAYDKAYSQSDAAKISRGKFYRKRIRQIREFLADYKLKHGCKDCGYRARYEALDFDHLPQFKKSFQLSQVNAHSQERLLREISKCEVVCANCHRVRTADRKKAAREC